MRSVKAILLRTATRWLCGNWDTASQRTCARARDCSCTSRTLCIPCFLERLLRRRMVLPNRRFMDGIGPPENELAITCQLWIALPSPVLNVRLNLTMHFRFFTRPTWPSAASQPGALPEDDAHQNICMHLVALFFLAFHIAYCLPLRTTIESCDFSFMSILNHWTTMCFCMVLLVGHFSSHESLSCPPLTAPALVLRLGSLPKPGLSMIRDRAEPDCEVLEIARKNGGLHWNILKQFCGSTRCIILDLRVQVQCILLKFIGHLLFGLQLFLLLLQCFA